MGASRATTRNLRIVRVDAENNLILVQGSVPGHRNTTVLVRRAKCPPPPRKVQAEGVPGGKSKGMKKK
jgi:large subunit ribosomal protein L3